jgi:murein L,D-transpeptidase YafK
MGFQPFRVAVLLRLAVIGLAAVWLAACQESDLPKAEQPVSYQLRAKMDRLDMDPASPIFIRIYKESSEFEVWKQKRNGDYALLTTFPICKWSGKLGPKTVEGDRQAPEGIYTVYPSQMNPASHYYLSFNIGYPNAYDRSLGHTGTNLMVHGACSSAGCYSMTDEEAGEIFALARDSFRGGQTAFQIQALPFHMTPENLARHRDDPNMPFWRMLKVGSDEFDLTLRPPKVDVCDHKYVFNADAPGATFNASAPCPNYTIAPALATALASKQAADDLAFQTAATKFDSDEKAAAAHAAEVAAKQQAAAAQQAAEAQQAAAQPSLWNRLFHKGMAEPAASVASAPIAAAAPVAAPGAQPLTTGTSPKVAKVPEPHLRPEEKPAVTPAASTPAPTVGTVVKKKFIWPGGDNPSNGNGSAGQSL